MILSLRVAAPNEVIGYTTSGIAIAPGTGDNMAGGLGLDVTVGDAVVSVGTSGTAFTKSHQQTHEPTGTVFAGFADATGEFLPLVHAQRCPESCRDCGGAGRDAGRAGVGCAECRAR